MGIEWSAVLLFTAAVLAGGINAIAGGGGLLVFPSLLLIGVSPISANATSAAGIWVGMLASSFAYRTELASVAHRLGPLTIATLLGAALGAWLLLNFSDEGFEQIVPYLVAIGTLLFTLSPHLANWSKQSVVKASATTSVKTAIAKTQATNQLPPLNQKTLILGQGIISTYGGFFGGGAGILMLTLLRLTNPGELQTLQSVKVWMALCINAAALSYFIFVGIINWPYAVLIAAGTSAGGYSSAYFAKKVPATLLRKFVITIGVALSLYFFWITYR
ncbi:MAG: sulfite exporter TauE/SafE family protein [Cyanobacteria bacterium J06621_11]